MWQELLQHGKGFIVEFCRRLRGADRRAFQAEVATEVCGGSPWRAESMFGWSGKSVENGLIEQQYDVEIQPHFDRRGRHEGQGGGGALLSPRTMSLENAGQGGRSRPAPRGETSSLGDSGSGLGAAVPQLGTERGNKRLHRGWH